MSTTFFRNLAWTPMRDLLRGRVTGRLDWFASVNAAPITDETRVLIKQVVRRTRLWKFERVDVADELIAHFVDATEAGRSPDRAIEAFGDPRQAAKLIRRAKFRQRPLAWHALRWAGRGIAALLLLYSLLFLRLYFSKPTIKIDYVAQLNAQLANVPESDRAWPIYNRVAITLGMRGMGGPYNQVFNQSSMPSDAVQVDWCKTSQPTIAMIREAASKPVLGWIYGDSGSIVDVESNHTSNGYPRQMVGSLPAENTPMKTKFTDFSIF